MDALYAETLNLLQRYTIIYVTLTVQMYVWLDQLLFFSLIA